MFSKNALVCFLIILSFCSFIMGAEVTLIGKISMKMGKAQKSDYQVTGDESMISNAEVLNTYITVSKVISPSEMSTTLIGKRLLLTGDSVATIGNFENKFVQATGELLPNKSYNIFHFEEAVAYRPDSKQAAKQNSLKPTAVSDKNIINISEKYNMALTMRLQANASIQCDQVEGKLADAGNGAYVMMYPATFGGTVSDATQMISLGFKDVINGDKVQITVLSKTTYRVQIVIIRTKETKQLTIAD